VINTRHLRRVPIAALVESGKLRVGDSATTKEYKQQLRKSIELLDQIIKQLEGRQ
jgi:hypothetical protein